MYFKNRHFSQDQGRFISRDPIRNTSELNLYQYVLSNPTSYIDSIGLYTVNKQCCCEIEVELKDVNRTIVLMGAGLGNKNVKSLLDLNDYLQEKGLTQSGQVYSGAVNTGSRATCFDEVIDYLETWEVATARAMMNGTGLFGQGLKTLLTLGFGSWGERDWIQSWFTSELTAHNMLRAEYENISKACQGKYAGCCGSDWQSEWCYGCTLVGPPQPGKQGEPPAPDPDKWLPKKK